MGIAVLGPLSVDGTTAPPRASGSGGAGGAGVAAGRGGAAPSAWPTRCGASGRRRRGTRWSRAAWCGCARLLGAERDRDDVPQGYRLVVPRDEVDAQPFERLVGAGRELLTLGEPDRAAYVHRRGAGAVAGPGAGRAGGLGARAGSRRRGWRSCAWTPRSCASTPRCGPGGTARCWPRPRRGWPRRRCGSGGGRCWRWPSTRPAGRATRCAPCTGPARCSPPSWASIPGPTSSPSSRRSCARTRRWSRRRRCPSPAPPARTWAWCRTTSATPTPSSAATPTSAACLRRLADDGRAGRGRAVGERQVVAGAGRGRRGPASATAAGWSWSRPGAHPDRRAAPAVPAPGPAPVLVVDQCEEVVTLCHDAGERARFFAALAAHAERGPLVVALRADRLGDAVGPPGVRPAGRARPVPARRDGRGRPAGRHRGTGPPGRPAPRAGSGRPAGARGRGRAGRAAAAVPRAARRPGSGARAARSPSPATAPPAASAARSPSRPRRSTSRCRAEQRPLLRDLLLRLVAPSPDGEPVPQPGAPAAARHRPGPRASSSSCSSAPGCVTSDDGVVELAHEALARAWPRLRGWLDDDVEGQRILRHLTAAADTWDAMGRPDSELYRGARLAQALDWRDRSAARSHRRPSGIPRRQPDPGRHRASGRRGPGPPAGPPEPTPPRPARGDRDLPGRVDHRGLRRRRPARPRRAARPGATARELAAAANANLEVDPERSILLALAAVERTRSDDGSVLPEAEEALHRAVTASAHRAACAGRRRAPRLEPGRHHAS